MPKDPKRILFIAPQPFFRERGTPIRARNILRGLTEAGYTVDVLCYPFGDPLAMKGLTIHRGPRPPGIRDVPVGPSPAKIPLNILLFFKAFWMCLKGNYGTIEAVEEAAFFSVVLKKIFRTRLVYDVDSHLSDHVAYSGFVKSKAILGIIRWVESITVRNSDLVITVCDSLTKAILRQVPGATILQLEDTALYDDPQMDREVSESLRKSLRIEGRPVALYTGNFGKYQGVDLLLQSIVHVKTLMPEVVFVIVGGRLEEVEAFSQKARTLGIWEQCRFCGIRPVGDIPGYVGLADVLLSPRTHGTNTPMKIYDYMQSGVPIVATGIETHTQVLNDTNSFLAAPEPAAYGAAVVQALRDKPSARDRAKTARADFDLKYSPPVFRARLKESFARLGKEV